MGILGAMVLRAFAALRRKSLAREAFRASAHAWLTRAINMP